MKILDVCCGSKMFYFDKENPNVTFMDIRKEYEELDSGHRINVNPDIIGDFREIPFPSDTFDLVIFDPPHLLRAGKNSWLRKKYGVLNKDTWSDDLTKGFDECWRVLKINGTLIFKWNEDQIKLADVLACFSKSPLIGNKRSKTHWLVFGKTE
ncbi:MULTISPECIES: class I SAM-dependent methyltransferase [Aerococcus]|uniref:class I SAM-dependent methyltransferase n=1 Tax=Aerococcus TaxID=1375 RepID=UPI0018A7259D|nr:MULTISPECIES: class I SAM-dependent methyltransferase [Aerococcus]MCY3067627.1 class I SAM-dependent methyltransferase [Aerococcus mictus]MCY3080471.1 class I SAM-dependent methyltransferase [Aerococcus mictus]MDK8484534.1 class I SAM-dependent methyltransferase [Aerococcus urinae]